MNDDQVQSFHSGRVSGCVRLNPPKPASSTCSRNRPARIASATSPIATVRVFVISTRLKVRDPVAPIPSASWQARRDSNPQHAVLETAALPLELLALDAPPVRAPPGRPAKPSASYFVSLWSVCLRHRGQNFGLTSLSVMVRLFLLVV